MKATLVYDGKGSYRVVVAGNNDGPMVGYTNIATCVVDGRKFVGFSEYYNGTGLPGFDLGGKVFEVKECE